MLQSADSVKLQMFSVFFILSSFLVILIILLLIIRFKFKIFSLQDPVPKRP